MLVIFVNRGVQKHPIKNNKNYGMQFLGKCIQHESQTAETGCN